MAKRTLLIILILVLLGGAVSAGIYFWTKASPSAQSGEGELEAYDFSLTAGGELPEDWSVTSYENIYEAYVREDALVLASDVDDDLRLVHEVTVQENTRYILSGYIKTEGVQEGRGAGLSIDNYSIDQSCVYSDGLFGDTDWTYTELAFETVGGQTRINLALRLGGYSEASSGTVYFKDVALRQESDPLLIYQTLSSWADASSDSDDEYRESEYYKAFFSVIQWAAVLSGVVMISCVYRNRRELTQKSIIDKRYKWGFAFVVLLGVALRLLLCSIYKGHDTDMNCFIAWGNSIAENGPSTFYTAAGHEWYDYPPGYMLFLGGYSTVLNLLKVQSYSVFGLFCYMLPAIAADFGCAVLLMRFAKSQKINNAGALILGGLTFLNPALLFLSGAWGQIDSILTFFLLLSFLLLNENKRELSALAFGVAVLMKWQALMFGPVYAFAHFFSINTEEKPLKNLLRTLLGAAGAFALIFLVSLPFKGDQGAFWIISKFLSATGGYDYASVEAYNYMAFCGGNWTASSQWLVNGFITYKTFGVISICFAVLCGMLVLLKSRSLQIKKSRPILENKGALFLAAALTMALIFTFGHYMHERYVVPVLLLLLFAYAYYKDKRLLLISMLFTVTTFLNEMSAMYVVSEAAQSIVRGGVEHNELIRFWSLAETAVCVYFAFVTADIFYGYSRAFRERRENREPSPKRLKWENWLEEGLKHE